MDGVVRRLCLGPSGSVGLEGYWRRGWRRTMTTKKMMEDGGELDHYGYWTKGLSGIAEPQRRSELGAQFWPVLVVRRPRHGRTGSPFTRVRGSTGREPVEGPKLPRFGVHHCQTRGVWGKTKTQEKGKKGGATATREEEERGRQMDRQPDGQTARTASTDTNVEWKGPQDQIRIRTKTNPFCFLKWGAFRPASLLLVLPPTNTTATPSASTPTIIPRCYVRSRGRRCVHNLVSRRPP